MNRFAVKSTKVLEIGFKMRFNVQIFFAFMFAMRKNLRNECTRLTLVELK